MPVAGDKVSISHSVVYDTVSSQALNCIEVRGQLAFRSDISTRLTVGTLMVYPGGLLQIGTPTSPVSAGVTAEVVIADQQLDTAFDPEQLGTGIIGLGKTTISGAPRTAFTRLTVEPGVGASTLSTGSTSGWRPGDRLFIPDTRHLNDTERTSYTPQWEERAAVSVGANSVTITPGLTYGHQGARDETGALTFLPHVANLSRNVIIRSANPSGTRGHILFNVRADVDIRYALLKDLGRTNMTPLDSTTFDAAGNVTHIGTNQIGRYALHMHHVMGPSTAPASGYQFQLIGNVIDAGKKWGITIHNSHYGLIQGNVVHNVDGSGIMTEDGSESYNLFEGNFIARINGPGGRGDERGLGDVGWEGTGVWLKGPNNRLRNNIAVNQPKDYGFKFFAYLATGFVNIPNFPGADTTVVGQYTPKRLTSMPIMEFTGNEVYGATQGGLTFWWISTEENNPDPNAQQSLIKDLHVWHVWDAGVYNYPSNFVTIDGLVVRGKSSGQSTYSMGFKAADYMARNLQIANSDIQGMWYGIVLSVNAGGGVQIVRNSYLRNAINLSIQTMWTYTAEARFIGPRKVVIRNVRFDTPVNGNVPAIPLRAIEMAYSANPVRNLIQRDDIFVYEFNGNTSDNFKAFYAEQRPSFIVPETTISQYNTHYIEGAPVPGLTNQQTWSTYGLAIAGAVAPCTTTAMMNDGFNCSIPWAPPQNDGLPLGPSPPTNVRVIR